MLIIFYLHLQKLVEHSNLPSDIPLASSGYENASSKSISCLVDVGLSPEVCVTVDQVHVDVLVFPISLSNYFKFCVQSQAFNAVQPVEKHCF